MIDPGVKNKVVLITGGNNPFGIGAAVAKLFSSQGARVFIHYYRQNTGKESESGNMDDGGKPGIDFYMQQQTKAADEVLASIRESGGIAASWETDLHNSEGVERLFDKTIEIFGQVDILVNNAADYSADTFLPVSVFKGDSALWDGGPERLTINAKSIDSHFAVNVRAAALLIRRFARGIIERKTQWGRIINISADCALGSPGEVSYRASKYALESYSRSAAAELGPYGITVNVVSPGPVQSGYISAELEKQLIGEIPLRRIGAPEDIARAVLFFASDQAAWITGQVLFVHGGHRMALA